MGEVDCRILLDLVCKASIRLNEKEVVRIGCCDVVLLTINFDFPQFSWVQTAAVTPSRTLVEIKIVSKTDIFSLTCTFFLRYWKIFSNSLLFILHVINDLEVSLVVETELVAVLDVGRELHASRDFTELLLRG